MKILVVGSRIPWPLCDGGAIATYQLLKELSALGAEVVYFSFNTTKHFVDQKTIEKQFSFCRVITAPLNANPTVMGALKALFTGRNYNISRFDDDDAKKQLSVLLNNEKFDLVQLEGLYASPFLNTIRQAGLTVSLRQHNAEFQIWNRLADTTLNPLKKLYFRLLSTQLKQYETAVLNNVDAIIPITNTDMDLFAKLAPGKPMFLLPVGQINQPATQKELKANTFFHLGSMEWMPNVEAVKWLVKEVWPRVMKKQPKASLHLAGKGMQKNDERFLGGGIVVHGEIENAQDFMQLHGVMLVPVFAAGGIRVKMLEAFAGGIPVISTTLGVQGIPALHERQLLIADTPEAFAAAMLRLQSEPVLGKELLLNAQNLIAEHFEARALIKGLMSFYEDFKCIK
ncbi:MAG: glycosyltransferase [Sphingomonadales bacterium]|nr:glycosyltransferase [Sphingomonadales bacterium]